MDKQQIFDKVLSHLRKQGVKSIKRDRCSYRGVNDNCRNKK